MSVIEHDENVQGDDDHAPHGHYAEGGNHHDTPQEKHRKEHIAVWLFIGGDAVFFLLEVFMWFYLRALNTQDGWRFSTCTAKLANSIGPTYVGKVTCTDGLFDPITHEIAKAAPINTIVVAALFIVSTALMWFAEVQAREGATRRTTTPLLGLALLFVLAAIGWQIYQFQVLPFSTIDGTYASTFEFFMGSNLAHFAIVLVLALGLFFRSRQGKFEGGRWYQMHLSRLFWVWIAASSAALAVVVLFFA